MNNNNSGNSFPCFCEGLKFLYKALRYKIGVQLVLLRVKYASSDMSVFETEAELMNWFIVSSFIYGAAWGLGEIFDSYLGRPILKCISLLFGYLAFNILALILSPLIGYVVLALFGLLMVGAPFLCYQHICNKSSTPSTEQQQVISGADAISQSTSSMLQLQEIGGGGGDSNVENL